MRAMKKKTASKISKGKLAKVLVFRGTKEKTKHGLTKACLKKSKKGRRKQEEAQIELWIEKACAEADRDSEAMAVEELLNEENENDDAPEKKKRRKIEKIG